MKNRYGFVSNSSAMSFHIYGWKNTELSKEMWDLEDFFHELRAKYPKLRWAYFDYIPENEKSDNHIEISVVGVGETAYEFDHYLDSEEFWETYELDCPGKDQCDKLDKIAEELKLPKPHLMKKTFWG